LADDYLRTQGSFIRALYDQDITDKADLASTASGKGAALVGINDAGGYLIATQMEAAIQELAKSNAFNLKSMFLAIGDGTTDDWAALQSFLTYAETHGGRYYLPKGKYRTTKTLKIGHNFTTARVIEIFGDGQGWVSNGAGQTDGSLIAGDTGALVLDLSGANTLYLHDFGIVCGTVTPSTCGIMTQRVASDLFIQRNRMARVGIAINTASGSNLVGTPTTSSAGGVTTVTGFTSTSAAGSIAFLNKRGEHWEYDDCDFYGDNPVILDGASNFSVAATGYTIENEAYPTTGATTTLHGFKGGFLQSTLNDCLTLNVASMITGDLMYFAAVNGKGAVSGAAANEVYLRSPTMEAAFGSAADSLGYFAKFLSDCNTWELGSVRTNGSISSTCKALYSAPGALINSKVSFGNANFGKLADGTLPGAVLKNVELFANPSTMSVGYTLASTATNVRVRQQTDEQQPTLALTAAGWGQASTVQRVVTTKDGRLVTVQFYFQTTLSGAASGSTDIALTGLPYTSLNLSNVFSASGLGVFNGITKAGYTTFGALVTPNTTQITFQAAGSGVAASTVKTNDLVAGLFFVTGTVTYLTSP
jgi:hypothetical protein